MSLIYLNQGSLVFTLYELGYERVNYKILKSLMYPRTCVWKKIFDKICCDSLKIYRWSVITFPEQIWTIVQQQHRGTCFGAGEQEPGSSKKWFQHIWIQEATNARFSTRRHVPLWGACGRACEKGIDGRHGWRSEKNFVIFHIDYGSSIWLTPLRWSMQYMIKPQWNTLLLSTSLFLTLSRVPWKKQTSLMNEFRPSPFKCKNGSW